MPAGFLQGDENPDQQRGADEHRCKKVSHAVRYAQFLFILRHINPPGIAMQNCTAFHGNGYVF